MWGDHTTAVIRLSYARGPLGAFKKALDDAEVRCEPRSRSGRSRGEFHPARSSPRSVAEEIADGLWNVYLGPSRLRRLNDRRMRIEDVYRQGQV